jgi:hypothetical protein
METVKHLQGFAVIEFRRYTIKDGQRERFARYFETYFPEAIQQCGAIVAGAFFERDRPAVFTWIRAFRDMDDRAKANAALYYGAVWKEHRTRMNALMVDSDDVLLLRPVSPERGLTILPAVDPIQESDGARGAVVAQIFPTQPGRLDAVMEQAEPVFAGYRAGGAREAGVLVTLEAPNNFPQLPVRTDGPFLVWLGIVKDGETLNTRLPPQVNSGLQALAASGLLREAPARVLLDPAPRSRLRWLPA